MNETVAAEPVSRPDVFGRLLAVCVSIGIFGVSLFSMPSGEDSFRLPKEIWFRGQGIVLGALLLIAAVWGRFGWRALVRDRGVAIVAFGSVLWTGIATLASSHRWMSAWTLAYVACGAVIFLAVWRAARLRTLLLADAALAVASIHAVICILAVLDIWYVVPREEVQTGATWRQIYAGGLLGHYNDMGSYLTAPAIAAVMLFFIVRGRRRLLYAAFAVVLVAGLFIAQSAAAIGAFVAAMFVVAFRRSWKLSLGAAVVLALLVGATAMVSEGLQRKITNTLRLLRATETTAYDLDAAMSNRLVPFIAAAEMTVDHPVFGVGPGRFGWHYYEYKLGVEERHRSLRQSVTNYLNFAEVHNDHLQVLATTGLVGYAFYLGALVVLARRSRRQPEDEDDQPARAARAIALPLAVGFAVLTLAQFPLELAAPTAMFLHWAALCVAWSGDATGA